MATHEPARDAPGAAGPDAGLALEERVAALEARLDDLEEELPEDRVSLVLFSGELDRVLAAFVIATGAAALGQQVSMFFTFWGYDALRRRRSLEGKSLLQRMMALASPGGTEGLPVSKMNYFGVGARMLRTMMEQENVASLEELMEVARETGVRMIACEMSREVLGIRDDELVEGLESGGAAAFLAEAVDSRATIFI